MAFLCRSRRFYLAFFALALSFAAGTRVASSQPVQVRDGLFYVDGAKFFVKGIGYETHTRPGQVPWEYKFDAAMIRLDLQRIKAANFNAIRTWSAIREEELKLVQESGLEDALRHLD